MLAVHEAGDPQGFPVLFHHGTPSAGLPYAPHAALAREQGIRLIGYDRPGYGDSTRARDRRVEACVADVTEIADALALDTFATWGISGGGPHALACAALLPDRVTAAALLASPAPFDADGLDWLKGQAEDNVNEHLTAAQGADELRELLEPARRGMLGA